MQCPALEMRCLRKCSSPEHCYFVDEYNEVFHKGESHLGFWLVLGMILWIVVLVAADYIFNLDLLPL